MVTDVEENITITSKQEVTYLDRYIYIRPRTISKVNVMHIETQHIFAKGEGFGKY